MIIAIWLILMGLIITAFILSDMFAPNILVLDIIVACIAWSALFWTWRLPWSIRLNDRRQTARSLGEMSVGWWSSICYAILVLGLIFIGQIFELDFKWQLIGQIALAVLLCSGILTVLNVGNKVADVEENERNKCRLVADLRRQWNLLTLQSAQEADLPADIKNRISNLNDDCRYITPSSSPQSRELDERLCNIAADLMHAIGTYQLNSKNIEIWLTSATLTLQQRKSTY